MDLSSFEALFGPPPAAAPPVDWEIVESWLGLQLPGDYKALGTTYGPLYIGKFVWLQTPWALAGVPGWDVGLRNIHRQCRIASREAPPYEPPAFHPAPGGLLVWGSTGASSELFWDTAASDDPDRWPVVVFEKDAVYQRISPWRNFGMPLLDTLVAFVTTGLRLPTGRMLGPLPRTVASTAPAKAVLWTPTPAPPEVVPEALRRAALTEGSGLPALRLLVPPPAKPFLGDGTWEQLFEELGTRLPDEYVALLDCYGAGRWSDWLEFFPPLLAAGRGFIPLVQQLLDGYRELRANWPQYHSLPVWPEPGGFLPFATTTHGDDVGWLTDGDPNTWPVIVSPRHADQGPPLPNNLIDTLLEWSRGRYSTPGFPSLDPLDDPLEFCDFKQPQGVPT